MKDNQKKLIELRVKTNFYKKLEKKIDSVMEGELEINDWSVKVRNKNRKFDEELKDLKFEMNISDDFMQWADAFFKTIADNDKPKYLDNYFSRELAFEDFKKANNGSKWLITKFKKAIIAYCELKNYTFNPRDYRNMKDRIIMKFEGKSQEAFYIRTTNKIKP